MDYTWDNVIDYMYSEVTTNPDTWQASFMRMNNANGCAVSNYDEMCYGTGHRVALAVWGLMVAPGGSWDHKPKLRAMFGIGSDDPADAAYVDVPGTDYRVRLDMWSNIHYGYVGADVGFTEETLIMGANAGPIAGANEPADDAATIVGYELRGGVDPENLSREEFEEAVFAGLEGIIEAQGGVGTPDGEAWMIECRAGMETC
ncbi:hypothetical protein GCM10029992_25450 [Glycomyces albus]